MQFWRPGLRADNQRERGQVVRPSFRGKKNAQGRTLDGLVWITCSSWTNHETKRIDQVTCKDWSPPPGCNPGCGVLGLAAFREIIMRGGGRICAQEELGISLSRKREGMSHTHTRSNRCSLLCGVKHSLLHVILRSTRVISKVGEAGVCSTLIPSTGIGPGS